MPYARIGVAVATTPGANICTEEMFRYAQRADGPTPGQSPEYVAFAKDIKEGIQLVLAHDWHGMAEYILEIIELLEKSDCKFIILPANTAHYAYDEIVEVLDRKAKESGKPALRLLNLIEIVAQECEDRDYKKVLITGTRATMKGTLYADKLKKYGIEPIVPKEKDIDLIHDFVINELNGPKVHEASKQAVLKVIQSYDCDAVALACTELPVVYNEENVGKPCLDTTRLLAQRAVDYAYKLAQA